MIDSATHLATKKALEKALIENGKLTQQKLEAEKSAKYWEKLWKIACKGFADAIIKIQKIENEKTES